MPACRYNVHTGHWTLLSTMMRALDSIYLWLLATVDPAPTPAHWLLLFLDF